MRLAKLQLPGSHGMSPAMKRMHRRLIASMALMLVTVLVRARWGGPDASQSTRLLLSLLVILPFAWMCLLYGRFLRECDELERAMELSILAWTGGIVFASLPLIMMALNLGLVAWDGPRVVYVVSWLATATMLVVRTVLRRRYA